MPFYGANRPDATVSQGVCDAFWLMSMQAGLKGALDCIKAFSERMRTCWRSHAADTPDTG